MKGLLLTLVWMFLTGCAARAPCDMDAAIDQSLARETGMPEPPAGCGGPQFATAWTAAVARRCTAQHAWDEAVAGATALPVCVAQGNAVWREAHHLGEQARRLESRQQQLTAQSNLAAAERLELVRIERELNEIRGAAQVRGWLADGNLP